MPTKTKPEMILWIAQNRGILTKVADAMRPQVSVQFVGQVARGLRQSKDGSIERKLKSLGAPIY
jgi:hypothetical protein